MLESGSHSISAELFLELEAYVPIGPLNIISGSPSDIEIDIKFQEEATLTISNTRFENEDTKSILYGKKFYNIIPCDNTYQGINDKNMYGEAENIEAVESAIRTGFSDILTLQKPIFYQDKDYQHTFFVEPSVTEQTVEEWQTWVTQPPQPDNMWHYQDNTLVAETPRDDSIHHAEAPFIGSADTPESLEKPKPEIDWLLNPATVLLFDNVPIGPRGRAGIELFPHTLTGVDSQVGVAGGTGLSRGTALVVQDDITFEQSGLKPTTLGVNVVGSSGSIRSLEANLNELNIQSQQGAGTGLGRGIRRIL